MVVFDSTVLLLVLDPTAKPPIDSNTQKPVDLAQERIAYLIQRLSKAGERIIIPTPVLSEVLVYADSATSDYLRILNEQAKFRIAPFDQKAAIEAAIAQRDAMDRGGLRVDVSNPSSTKAKIKFDRQIVAIAKAEGAHTVYSDDDDVIGYATRDRIKAFRTSDLDLPPEDPQTSMNFEDEDKA